MCVFDGDDDDDNDQYENDDDDDNDQYDNDNDDKGQYDNGDDDKGGPMTVLPSSTWRVPVQGEGSSTFSSSFSCMLFYVIFIISIIKYGAGGGIFCIFHPLILSTNMACLHYNLPLTVY